MSKKKKSKADESISAEKEAHKEKSIDELVEAAIEPSKEVQWGSEVESKGDLESHAKFSKFKKGERGN